MTSSSLDDLASVTVTLNPDLGVLSLQLSLLQPCSRKILVDNGSSKDVLASLVDFKNRFDGVELIELDSNMGLPFALNWGISHVLASGDERFVLLLDQDSEPAAGSVQRLAEAYAVISEKAGAKVGAVGPMLQDPDTGLSHGFHVLKSFRWTRVFPSRDAPPVRCASINGSGTYMSLDAWRCLGGLDEELFIDHVDTEWSFRLLASGYSLWGIPSAVFVHRMGTEGVRFWFFGWKVWPVRSALRIRYLFRNAVILMRRRYVPVVWKVSAVVKLFMTFVVSAIFGPWRINQLRAMLRGIVDGMFGRSGAL
ncbi:MAG: glycosyltransferase [Pseudoxanthomonas mexicana]|nr:glycosyltransferase [Pseudoxanthomonas mexicana]